jgi:hypothetical protein
MRNVASSVFLRQRSRSRPRLLFRRHLVLGVCCGGGMQRAAYRSCLAAAAVSLASARLFSNDHSRADLPLATAGHLLVVNVDQRHPPRPPPPVLLKPQLRTLRPTIATAVAEMAADDVFPTQRPALRAQALPSSRASCGPALARRHY